MSDNVHISVIVGNISLRDDLIAEHGLSLWIEYKDRRLLFDTGQSKAVISNAKKLGIDLSGTDAIVISHGHYDHAGGLFDALDIAANAKIFLHSLATEPKFSRKKSNVKYIGMSESAKKAIKSRNVILTEKPVNLFPGMVITGQVPRTNDFEDVGGAFFLDENCMKPDNLLDDQTLFLESSKGLVVVFGCAHSGVVNILDYISKLTGCKNIYAVIGGMHLLNSSHNRIENTIKAFRKYEIQKIMPMHCTGQKAMEELKNVFGDKCLLLGAGDKISF